MPGIGLSPDKMLLARLFSYADAHRARLGVNYKQIPVNDFHILQGTCGGRISWTSIPERTDYWRENNGTIRPKSIDKV